MVLIHKILSDLSLTANASGLLFLQGVQSNTGPKLSLAKSFIAELMFPLHLLFSLVALLPKIWNAKLS